jgi:mono/diheme cytochrome c family protein
LPAYSYLSDNKQVRDDRVCVRDRLSEESMKTNRAAACAALVASALFAAPAFAQDAASGYFTAEQASHGKAVWASQCSACHGVNMEGTEAPGLVGVDVMGSWGTAQGIYDYYSEAMPATNPGGLTEEEYVDIMAHILAVNGAPAGTHVLKLADFPDLQLVAATSGVAPAAPAAAPVPAPAAPAAAPAAPKLPQAFTANQNPPAAAPAATPAPAPAAPKLPQAFTFGKDAPPAAPATK